MLGFMLCVYVCVYVVLICFQVLSRIFSSALLCALYFDENIGGKFNERGEKPPEYCRMNVRCHLALVDSDLAPRSTMTRTYFTF